MQQITRKQLAEGVFLTCLSTTRFKTSVLSAAAVLPVTQENALAALLPQVLARGTARCPDMESLGVELDRLYGARILPFVRKVGENLSVGFLSDVIDGTYAAAGEDLTGHTIELLAELWNAPYRTEDGTLCPEYTAAEGKNLMNKILGLKNDTRSYAVRRMQEIMCEGEPFGWCEYGSAEAARTASASDLTAFWQDTLQHAPLELFYCGSAPAEQIEAAFRAAFAARTGGRQAVQAVLRPAPAQPRTVIEEMDVQQGKLSLGFRTGITGGDAAYPAMMLFVTAFGGYTGSRLFRQVREKMSLCYYASATMNKHKGIISVSSGIENSNFETARDEILRQLAQMQDGLTEDELEGARRTLLGSLRAMNDAPASLEWYFQSQAIGGWKDDLDELCDALTRATRDEVLAAGRTMQLDTIYFLKGVAQA